MVWSLWKTVWQYLMKLNIYLPCNPGIMLLGIYPREMKTYAHTKAFHKCVFLWLCSAAQSCLTLCNSMDYIAHHQARLSMEFSSKNTGAGCRFLLQGIFLTQGSSWPISPALAGRFFTTEPRKFLEQFCL